MRKHITEAMFDVIAGTTTTYTPAEHNPALGATDKLAMQTIFDQVTGTTPTITMTLEHSNDQRNWVVKTTLQSGTALATNGATSFIHTDAGTTPTLGFVRIGFQLGGTTPQARVKML